ncbi:hypothetical protein [Mycolicibacterium septicum]|uniref:hypothetical protein n=1 Tax=Mycolicibacterium septicum TaxID=98668 RepID=UPI002362ECA6|nr:hypothetical protein [Mycolicibacterium septicum]
MPTPPSDHPLNLTMQTVATVVLRTATAAILVVAIRWARRERTAGVIWLTAIPSIAFAATALVLVCELLVGRVRVTLERVQPGAGASA